MRLDVKAFVPSRSQRRALTQHAALSARETGASVLLVESADGRVTGVTWKSADDDGTLACIAKAISYWAIRVAISGSPSASSRRLFNAPIRSSVSRWSGASAPGGGAGGDAAKGKGQEGDVVDAEYEDPGKK